MKKAIKVITFSGVWFYPIGLAVEVFVIKQMWFSLGYNRRPPPREKYYEWLLYPLIVCLFILFHNWEHSFNKEPGITNISENKRKAMYPKVPPKYLSRKMPKGFLLGEYNKKYVYFPMNPKDIIHGIIWGAPGIGKSAAVYFPTLIGNFMHKKNEQFACYVIDVKPELFNAVEAKNNPCVRVMNITQRSTWGWDVYYQVTTKTTDSEMVRILKRIGRCLITGNEKDKFFTNNAIKLFCGIMLYLHKKGNGFIDSIIALTTTPFKEQVENILNDRQSCGNGSKIRALLSNFSGKDSDALQDIELSLQEELDAFVDDDVIWHLRDNPKKATPYDLFRGISVFNSTPEDVLDDLAVVFRLQVFQVLEAMQAPIRSRKDTIPCAVIIDEAYRIGKIDQLKNALATLRSKKCSVWLALQDISQLQELYGKEGARQIMNLCRIKCILSCDDNETAEIISTWPGKYRERRITKVGTGKDQKINTAYEYRDIIEPSDIMTLDEHDEMLLFIKGRYMRIKKHYYFEDSILNQRYEEVYAANEALN